MSAQAITLPHQASSSLRPFDVRRDLLAVADLVELCFAGSLDADGRLYIRQMRQAARNGAWGEIAAGSELPLSGMVWLEGGRLVGNLSLIPHTAGGRRIYLIANVAVHPDYRGRGIARELTHAALDEIEERGSPPTWLQVDETNATAVRLYSEMGFIERMRRTSWRLQPDMKRLFSAERTRVRPARAADWAQQKEWLEQNYPQELRWHLPLDMALLQPGLLGSLQRVFSERRSEQWSAERDGQLLGVLSWQSSALEADRVWLASEPGREEAAIPALAALAHGQFNPRRKLALNYAAGRAAEPLQAAGFSAARTLIWMELPWKD
jgi:ribosomal protein S18 acetylase RimI-like enzyme